ncbi:MAG: ABC transporter permease subunit [Oscillospiraceae bacterium]|nr:ABC transporter permease subunit [Oscillospiraceae bacterium]
MKRQTTIFLLLLPFLAVTGIVLVSIWNVLVQSLGYIPAFGLTKPTLDYYIQVFSRADFLSAVWVSVRIALWSAVFSVCLGVLLAMALIKCRKTRGGMLYAVRLPILVPHAVVAVFVIQILSQTGLAARFAHALGFLEDYSAFPQLLFTPSYLGTILAYLWKEIPFVAYFVLAFMSSISDTLGEAAENLGASSLRSFWEVTLPLSVPVISRAGLIIFIFAFGGYELPLLLGSTLPKALSVQTYLVYMSPDLLQRPLAMAMNGVVLLLSAGMALAYSMVIYRLNRKVGGVK